MEELSIKSAQNVENSGPGTPNSQPSPTVPEQGVTPARYESPKTSSDSPRFNIALTRRRLSHSSTSPAMASPPSEEDEQESLKQKPSVHDSKLSKLASRKFSQSKIEDLRKTFDLPISEALIDDYVCALKKKVLFQGRLYVFENHLCFYCSLFGYTKMKSIPLNEIHSMHKKKNVGFPNSISIKIEGGKQEFFTSFLRRDDAFTLIEAVWEGSSEMGRYHAQIRTDTHLPSSSPRAKGPVSTILKGLSIRRHKLEESLPFDQQASSTLFKEGDQSFASAAEVPVLRSSNSSADSNLLESDKTAKNNEIEDISELQCRDMVEWESIEHATPAPPVHPEAQLVLDRQLSCSPKMYWCRFLSNRSRVYTAFLTRRGDTDIRITPWKRHYQVGMVRDVSFVAQVKSKMAPPRALCHQSQRFEMHHHDHLVYESRQVMPDLPYGDHFTVESRWDITNVGENMCRAQLHVRIPFGKSTMLKRVIEKSAMSSMAESAQLFIQLAEESLKNGSEYQCMEDDSALDPLRDDNDEDHGDDDDDEEEDGADGHLSEAPLLASPPIKALKCLPGSNEEWEQLVTQATPEVKKKLNELRAALEALGCGMVSIPIQPMDPKCETARFGALCRLKHWIQANPRYTLLAFLILVIIALQVWILAILESWTNLKGISL